MWRARDLGEENPGDPAHWLGDGLWLTVLRMVVRMVMGKFIGSLSKLAGKTGVLSQ